MNKYNDKNKFLKYLKVVYDIIFSPEPKYCSEAFNYVKKYMFNNPSDEDVIIVKNWIIDTFQTPFLDQTFQNALLLPDNLEYYKIQQVFKYLPFMLEKRSYKSYFSSLIWTEPSNHFYDAFFKFLKSEGKCLISDDIINKTNEFATENRIIQISGQDKYNSYNDELNIYKNLLLGKTPIEFKKFEKEVKQNNEYNRIQATDYEILEKFENKTLGNIGELYIFEKLIIHCENPIFTSRDLGNGFGYDMYYQSYENNQIIENLIEVKSTANLNGDDYMKLSPNEYTTLTKTLDNPNVNYYICRVFVDITKNDFYYCFLKLEGNILRSTNYNNDGIEYEISENNNLEFTRKQKIKTLN